MIVSMLLCAAKTFLLFIAFQVNSIVYFSWFILALVLIRLTCRQPASKCLNILGITLFNLNCMIKFVQSCLKRIYSFYINHILRQLIPCTHHSITKEMFTNIQAKTIFNYFVCMSSNFRVSRQFEKKIYNLDYLYLLAT